MNKSYNKLVLLDSFEERFEYLKLSGVTGESTFGYSRYLNQILYQNKMWKIIRNKIIIRDDGCDLAIPKREILYRPTVHHINPITIDDVELGRHIVFDQNNLILTSHITHEAIHYGNYNTIPQLPQERTKGDTCPWKQVF